MAMEAETTQKQFQLFLQFFGETTDTLYQAIYYSGLFIGLIIFPIYAIYLIRKNIKRRMDEMLREITQWDPWLWSRVTHGSVFYNDKAVKWLSFLCKNQTKYRGVMLAFGFPDIEAKSIQLTKAFLSVCLFRIHEIKNLPQERQDKIISLLQTLKKKSRYEDIDKIISLVNTPDEQEKRFQELHGKAARINNWKAFLYNLSLPLSFSPKEAAEDENISKDHIDMSLFLLAKNNKEPKLKEDLNEFIKTLHHRFVKELRIDAVHIDKYLNMDRRLQEILHEVISSESLNPVLEKCSKIMEWNEFISSFGISPVEFISGDPNQLEYRTLHENYSQKRRLFHRTANIENLKELDIAWEVIQKLKRKGIF
jgi:hypothetical protein